MSKGKSHIINRDVLVGCKNQQGHAQRKLYEATIKLMYNVVYRIVADHQETQDVLQDAYCKIFEKFDQFDENKGNAIAWMNRICVNTAINYIRRNRVFFDAIEHIVPTAATNITALMKMEAEYILEAIQKLPPQDRIIFNLYEVEGYSHKEIASMININVNSCRTYLSRAKVKLQKMLNDQEFSYSQKMGS